MIAGGRVWRRCRIGLALVALAAAGACSAPRDPITVDEGEIVVENMTDVEWRDVRIVVNHHFAGGVPRLEAGGRMNAPLSRFQTAFGQRFDRGRQSVFKIEVTAREEPGGKLVTLSWGEDQRK
jgi:hypothetical protein